MPGKKFKQRKTDVIQDGIVYRLENNANSAYKGTYYVYTYTEDLPEKVVVADRIEGLPVTFLDKKCFYHSECREVILPDTIEVIKADAFSCCENLEEISIPNTIETVESGAFKRCDKLKQAMYSHGLYIGNSENPYLILRTNKKLDMFTHDGDMVVEVHPETKFILDTAFSVCHENGSLGFDSCVHLRKLILHDKLHYIDQNAFCGRWAPHYISTICIDSMEWLCKSGVRLPGRSTERLIVGGKDTNGEIIIPATVTDIPQKCFMDYDFIKCVRFEGNISTIGWQAFSRCGNLREVYLPKRVGLIGHCAFLGCMGLNNIDFYEVEEISLYAFGLPSVSSYWYKTQLEPCEVGLKKITFHERIGKICLKAFLNNYNLHSIDGLENVETIEGDPFEGTPFENKAE